jgi:glycosyltransferase involved in cell wall biosynthesis
LIGNINKDDPYHRSILKRIEPGIWQGRVTVTGFLDAERAARLLASADAVVLPFRQGGGAWNTTLQSALIQGTFVLTTSQDQRGFDPVRNVYYAEPGNLPEMRQALTTYLGHRLPQADGSQHTTWKDIAAAHEFMYRAVLKQRGNS